MYKSKNHHDVVLINSKEHSDYEVIATEFKDEIAGMYGVKTINQFNVEYTEKIREIKKEYGVVPSILHSIIATNNNVKSHIIWDKLKLVSELGGIPLETLYSYNYIQLFKLYKLTNNNLKEVLTKFKTENRIYYDHGYHVVRKLDTEEKISVFIKLWRVHFIETMKPKYMPKGWSIDFRIKNK
jgi:hypothetical protein